MDKKGWRGADLVFDIDADHILLHVVRFMTVGYVVAADSAAKGLLQRNAQSANGQSSTLENGCVIVA